MQNKYDSSENGKEKLSAAEASSLQVRTSEQALQDSHERFRTMIESLCDWLWEVDQNGVYTYVSPKVFDLLGYTPEQILGKTPFDFMPQEEAKRAAVELQSIFKEQKSFSGFENINLHKDGRLVVLETSGVPVVNPAGQFCGYRGIDRDITARKQAETKLTELKQAVDHAVDGIIVTDMDANVVFANQSWARMHGWRTDEFTGRHVSIFHNPEQLADVQDSMEQLFRKGTHTFNVGHARRDGTTFPTYMSAAILKDAGGKPAGLIGVARDITEQKKAEEELKDSETMFRAIFDNASDGIVLVNAETKKFYMANKKLRQMLGYSYDEFLALGVADVHPAKDLPYVLEQFGKQARREIELAKDLPVQRKDGSVFYADINTSPVTLNGRTYMLGIFRDTTARKEAETKLLELKNAVEQAVDGIAVATMEGNIIFANQSWAKMHGFKAEELPGKALSTFHTPEQLAREVQPSIEKMVKEGFFANEVGHMRRDGTTFPAFMSGASIKDADGKLVRLVGVARDITEQKKAEEELRFKNTVLLTQQEVAIDGILVVDENGKIVSTNRHFVDMWGIPSDVIESKSDERALQAVMDKLSNPEEFISKVKHLYNASKETSKDEVALKDGRVFDRYSAPMRSADGKYYGRVWYFRDITEQKLAETRIKAANQQLSAANQQLRAANEQLRATDQIKAVNQQLKASEQQLQAANQQLRAKEQALQTSQVQLRTKLSDLEQFNRLMVGRELDMIKLKGEVNALLEKQGQTKKYETA